MKPQTHESLKVARRVLSKLDLPKHVAKRSDVICYENGREHGLAIRHFDGNAGSRMACFAESRNTDQIVVYVGRVEDFDTNGNIPSEKVYQARKFFGNGQYEKAARFIAQSISK